jgi:2-polyprenyl-6-methoxyphenol hydroxylase-like FAD-dependent oxidoreductase
MASQPLNIVIVGAGIAGLYAGTALKKAGHLVEVVCPFLSLIKDY